MSQCTDETIIIDAENDLNLQENEELLDDDEEDDAKPPKRNINCSQTRSSKYLKIGLYTFHLILKLVVNNVGLSRFRAKSFS